MRSKKLQLHHEQRGHCWFCTRVVDVDAATVDHLVPLSKGGSHEMKNLVMACRPCNAAKASRPLDAAKEKTKGHRRWLISLPAEPVQGQAEK